MFNKKFQQKLYVGLLASVISWGSSAVVAVDNNTEIRIENNPALGQVISLQNNQPDIVKIEEKSNNIIGQHGTLSDLPHMRSVIDLSAMQNIDIPHTNNNQPQNSNTQPLNRVQFATQGLVRMAGGGYVEFRLLL